MSDLSNVKKMVVIDQQSLERMKTSPTPALTRASALDSEMERLLQSDMDAHDKWVAYNQLLQRYLHIADGNRKPVTIRIVDKQSGGPSVQDIGTDANDPIQQQVVNSVPNAFRRKAGLLYSLLRNSGLVNWNARGEISLDGSELRGSNIVDLISDAVRLRKNFNPAYSLEFAALLSKLNAPQELVGNPERWKLIQRARMLSMGSPLPRSSRHTARTASTFGTPQRGEAHIARPWESLHLS